MKRLLILAVLAVSACLPQRQTVAPTFLVESHPGLDERIGPLLDFIYANSVVGHAPVNRAHLLDSIVTVDPEEMVTRASSPFGRDVRRGAMTTIFRATKDGRTFYVPAIFMDGRQFSFDDQWQVAALVHELVHYYQLVLATVAVLEGGDSYTNLAKRMGWDCDLSLEAEAYRVQNLWLAKSRPASIVPASRISDYSRCSGNGISVEDLIKRAPDIREINQRPRAALN